MYDDYTVTNADLAELGINVDDNATAEQTSTETQNQEQATAQSAESNASAEQNPQTAAPANVPEAGADKQAYTFAKLRSENKAMNQLLNELAKTYNISGKDSAEVMSALKDHLITKKAEQQNVPKELLERLTVLEAKEAEYTQYARAQKAQKAFDSLVKEFNLSQDQLMEFVSATAKDGLNPFERDDVDVRREYIVRNFQNMIKAAEERGARAESERASKAATNSTSPVAKNNPTAGTQQQRINTISEFESLLAQIDKK